MLYIPPVRFRDRWTRGVLRMFESLSGSPKREALRLVLAALLFAAGGLAFGAESAGAQEGPSITITTDAADEPDKVFRYEFVFARRDPIVLEQKHGETTTVDLSIGNWHINFEESGWAEIVTCSVNGAPESEQQSWSDDAWIFLTTATASADCTFTHLNAGSSTLTLAFESDDPQDSITFNTSDTAITVAAGESQAWTSTAMKEFLLRGGITPGAPGAASCVTDDGQPIDNDELSVTSVNVVGRLPIGSDVLCTFTRLDEFKTIPLRFTAFGLNVPVVGEYQDRANESVDLALLSGVPWTGEAIIGNTFNFALRTTIGTSGFWAVTDFNCMGDDGQFPTFDFSGGQNLQGDIPYTSPLANLTGIDCVLVVRDRSIPFGIFPTVSCLGGNGRIDVNVWNDHQVPREYTLTVGALAPRVFTINGKDWSRRPVTGRPDGPIAVRLERLGEVLLDTTLDVACDVPDPAPSGPEVQVINACRSGLGFVAWQFDNPTDTDRVYIISFDGVPNRSTTAAPLGASVRGVSGRQNGTYNYTIRANGELIRQDTVQVSCD